MMLCVGLAGHVWHDNGAVGVALFLALSGYLIEGLILDEIRNHGLFDVRRFKSGCNESCPLLKNILS